MAQRSLLQRFIVAIYGLYAAICLVFVTICVIIMLILPLKVESLRKISSTGARLWFVMAGIPVQQSNRDALATSPAVVVANHASYIDGILLHAVLPTHFSFVIKREVTKVPLLHFLLRRIGSHFVERSNRHRGGRDARNILKDTSSGRSIAIFPEGTFIEEPGLQRFHTGAFAAAVTASQPVIPVVLHGTRDILSADQWLPRPGKIHVQFLAAINSEGTGREAMRALAHQSRHAILEYLDEPDKG